MICTKCKKEIDVWKIGLYIQNKAYCKKCSEKILPIYLNKVRRIKY